MTTHAEESILEEAGRLPEQERASFLEEKCGADNELRRRLETRLGVKCGPQNTVVMDKDATLTHSSRAVTDPFLVPGEEKLGSTIGRYKLLEMSGEGGFGSVYVAEQQEPVRRRVALKVIKLGMDTKQVVARFEAERQALAMMDHPNIAKVFDAGATETGRPYFVMELVRGVRITEYCDENKLTTRQRLKLFVQVCRAIEHAHQKGIIHRDIKPSNILVSMHDGAEVIKVIDFGIAKATSGNLTDKTVFTQGDQFVGTPAYMSPEQAEMSGMDIDTRSDIYSLGVLLYELLTSETPFESKNLLSRGFDEMRRIIREMEPQLPSLRLRARRKEDQTTAARRHGTDAPRLIKFMSGDLDWVVMKCLEKDRARRYETADSLGVDVQRFLDDEPVAARPPSNIYRFKKLVRRNRLAFAAAGGIWLALVIALGVSTYYVIKEKQQRDLAEIETAAANRDRQNADVARAKAQAAEKKALESQMQAEAARAKAEEATRKAQESAEEAKAARIKAEEATARAVASETEAKAALQQAREEREKAKVADQQAEVSKSEAQTARQQATVAISAAEKLDAEKSEAIAVQGRLKKEAEAASQRAAAVVEQTQANAAAAAAEAAQWRSSLSNLYTQLDALPAASIFAIANAFLASPGQIQPWAAPLLRHRGEWRARQGDWTEAAADFSSLVGLEPDRPEAYDALAHVLAQTGDWPGYGRICGSFLTRFGGRNDLEIMGLVAKDCLLASSTNVDVAKVAGMARQVMDAGTNDSRWPSSRLTLGLAEYRQGHFAEAAVEAAKALAGAGAAQDAACQAEAAAVLALAEEQLKQTNLARATLATNALILQVKLPKAEKGDLGPKWEEGVAARVLGQEAKTLIETPVAAK
jgi:serine/threonine protein kinase